jgi:UDP-N-acetylmuramate dehydrogenase
MTVSDAIAQALPALGARADVPIGPYTTYRVGGNAAWFLELDDVDRLLELAAVLSGSGVPVLVVGNGSNLLVADAGFDGVAVRLGGELAQLSIDETTVRAGGAALLPVVARRTASAGLTGFEWAVGVPGSVGGAVRMNAGGHGSDMAGSVTRVRLVDLRSGRDEVVAAADLAFGYRSSAVRDEQVVVWAELGLEEGDRDRAEAAIADVVRWRREHQPGGANAGSVFTNPTGDAAGRLIDAAGAKGLRVGTAEVSDKHANFIQVDEGGSADDVYALMALVRQRVFDDCGVVLAPETHLVGYLPLDPPHGAGDDTTGGVRRG